MPLPYPVNVYIIKYAENVATNETLIVIIDFIFASNFHAIVLFCNKLLIIVVTAIAIEITIAFNKNALKYVVAEIRIGTFALFEIILYAIHQKITINNITPKHPKIV